MDLLAAASWTLIGTEPGTVSDPAGLDDVTGAWLPAQVPGTVAGALRAELGAQAALHTDIDGRDWWWRTCVEAHGAHLLIAEGLATVADVWVNGIHVVHSQNMFRRSVHELPLLAGSTELVIRFAAPMTFLGRQPRPRWKSTLVPEQRWRFLRTTVLGRIPTWAGTAPPAGPWRPLRLESLVEPVIARQRIASRLESGTGVVDLELDVRGDVRSATARCGGATTELRRTSDGALRGSLQLAGIERWWPHSHGGQPRYEVSVSFDGRVPVTLTHTAFRTVELDTGGGGWTLRVNGVDVFARGACWTAIDPLSLQASETDLRAAVAAARDAGHNIIRVQGTWVYESDAFYAICDELGMLVWQDCAVATLDLPQTEEFASDLTAEVGELADRLAGRACIAVVCGGAETEQQPAMLGLRDQTVPAITDTIPAVLADRLPGAVYVRATPSGGVTPMQASAGIAQYFGVGAYLAPLNDVRAARVRFAGECLAFSTPPEADALARAFGSARVAGHDPAWKHTVPRDVTAAWDFEDVRDHYVREIFAVDPMRVRYADPERYLDLGRAAVSIAMTEVMTWWRRPASQCSGAIVLNLRDQVMGAGWGLLDAHGRGKAPWFALRPVLAPTALLVSDDGADGITITVVNDRAETMAGELEVRTWSESGSLVDEGALGVEVAPRSAVDVGLDAVLGRFTDAGAYYRFGPSRRDLLQVLLRASSGEILMSRTAELGHHLRPVLSDGLAARVQPAGDGWSLQVSARRPLHWVAIDSPTHEPEDSWFHLAPGETRSIGLVPVGSDVQPRVTVRALDHLEIAVAAPDAAGGGP